MGQSAVCLCGSLLPWVLAVLLGRALIGVLCTGPAEAGGAAASLRRSVTCKERRRELGGSSLCLVTPGLWGWAQTWHPFEI